MDRVRPDPDEPGDREITERLLRLLSQVKSTAPINPEQHGRLAIKERGRVVFLDLDEIDWIGAAANYVTLNVGKEAYFLRETIARTAERAAINAAMLGTTCSNPRVCAPAKPVSII